MAHRDDNAQYARTAILEHGALRDARGRKLSKLAFWFDLISYDHNEAIRITDRDHFEAVLTAWGYDATEILRGILDFTQS
ncbi:hypothetical protein [uncultured Maritimibacter sp.]|uniref:hypothetical protein n=1 Tax=uncultured Maritimibacter sp. TaxID=991866 RepID=UPI002594CC7B|nr:hypothetical protein [uncultured Maritimibacter sp.]